MSEYHNNTHPVITIIITRSINRCNASATNAAKNQEVLKWETSGRLGTFMPQISHDENIKNNNKTHNKELAKTLKKYSHVTIAPRFTCATLTGQATQIVD
jgi:hypothetical protein